MRGMKARRSRKAVRENLELVKLAQRFEIHNRSDGKSPRTVQWYNQTVEVFTGWLESEGMSTRLDDVGEDEARLFILNLQERRGLWGKASSHTVNNRVRALRAFFNWLYRQVTSMVSVLPCPYDASGSRVPSVNPSRMRGSSTQSYSLNFDLAIAWSELHAAIGEQYPRTRTCIYSRPF